MKIQELKDQINQMNVLPEEEVNSMTKKELENILNANAQLDKADIQVNDETTLPGIDDNVSKLSTRKSNWTEYVMSQFTPDEIEGGNPKVDGLRRVAEQELGGFSQYTTIVDSPNLNNQNRAVVHVRLSFDSGRIVEGAADVFGGNTDYKFAKHPVATAESRAEGRALRKALKLVKVIAAEEVFVAEGQEVAETELKIPETMTTSLQLMANRVGVDLNKVLLSMDIKVDSLNDLTKQQGLQVAQKINDLQKSGDIENVKA
jgi:hypothetical protein